MDNELNARIDKLYSHLKATDPRRLFKLAKYYQNLCGYSDNMVDGLDAIIHLVVFRHWSDNSILKAPI